jgi:hypothetical protein
MEFIFNDITDEAGSSNILTDLKHYYFRVL